MNVLVMLALVALLCCDPRDLASMARVLVRRPGRHRRHGHGHEQSVTLWHG
jgi:hypothetical protein